MSTATELMRRILAWRKTTEIIVAFSLIQSTSSLKMQSAAQVNCVAKAFFLILKSQSLTWPTNSPRWDGEEAQATSVRGLVCRRKT